MINFNDTNEFKKGNIGEEIVKYFLEKKEYIIYKSITKGPHPLDYIVFKINDAFPRFVEIKTYPRRNLYLDTGINYNHYEIYKKQKLDVYLFFVDELEKKVYGNKLSFLNQKIKFQDMNYPKVLPIKYGDKKGEKRIYFSLSLMELYLKFGEKTSNQIKKYSKRNYDYNNAKKFNFKWLINENWK